MPPATSPSPSKKPAMKSPARKTRVAPERPTPGLAPGIEPRAVVVLSGGAPNGAMMAAALSAIYKCGKTFNTIFSSGAGALFGMLYAAPKLPFLAPDQPPPPDPTLTALLHTLDSGICDEIYRWFPVGYKTFLKSGPFAANWIAAAQKLKVAEPATRDSFSRYRRLYNDSVDFWAAATCPTDTTPFSKGLCAPFPFLKAFIDFDRLNGKDRTIDLYMNTYHIESTEMQQFGPGEITPDHFDAAVSYPFIYHPKQIVNEDGVTNHYFEGGCSDPLNLEGLADRIEDGSIVTRTVVIIDILGMVEAALVRVPTSLWDAYGISIMLPVVSLARMSQRIFDMRMKEWNATHPETERIETFRLTFDIPPSTTPVTDWSDSNMRQCWDIGWAAGERFIAETNMYNRLPFRRAGGPEPILWTPKKGGSKPAAKRRPSATRATAR